VLGRGLQTPGACVQVADFQGLKVKVVCSFLFFPMVQK
jgi:hypothetical protein